ncbi:MAG TPA: sarcosine oxidase subunit gamma [Candidatus Nesterenkonia stercoripullorum]|uniref:Sarcosine oxidase subunit gamma n=1 Tax=Candidatus Nesterenkonia stercoripullorum TaxID=2838701 RepID=A0A9D1UT42_9MICC|nr:sarcosine oxidase subunit gamma [Candidatus Nesterenkonia stercoripullorum]
MEAASRESRHAATLREIRFPQHIGLRCTPGTDAAEALEHALGLSLPRRPLSSTGDPDGAHILWLSPDEFLYVDVTGEHVSLDALSSALEGLGGQAVDLSSNRATLELSGTTARDVLESGCRIDLHPREFPVGMVVSTLLSTVNVIIHRSGEDVFRVIPRSSFAHYTVEWLLDAMAGHVPEYAAATR